MIGQMAIAGALPGFNDLGRTVTPIFLLMDHFLYQFSTFSEKMKKSIDWKLNFFAKCTIEFRSVKLFVHLYDGFKCLLKSKVL